MVYNINKNSFPFLRWQQLYTGAWWIGTIFIKENIKFNIYKILFVRYLLMPFFSSRFRKFLLWLGTPPAQVRESKPGTFCRIVSEFALEYRTTRDRVLQQMEKKANHRERSKTRGKMITQIGNSNGNGFNSLASYEPISYRTKEDRADAELRQLLGSDISDTESMRTGTWGRSRKSGTSSSTLSIEYCTSFFTYVTLHTIISGTRTQHVNSWRLSNRYGDRWWRWDPWEPCQNRHAHSHSSAWTEAKQPTTRSRWSLFCT